VDKSCREREACSCCRSDSWNEAPFCHGQGIICEGCWCLIQATKGRNPPSQRTLPGVEVERAQGAIRG
jgi:hypothetical protein